MFISDLENGSKITLSIKIGSENVEFVSKVMDVVPKKHAILAEVVKDGDKVVSFNGSNIFVDVYFHPENDSPIVFRNVKVIVYKDKSENVYYVIASNSIGITVNRREAFRIYVGANIVVQKGLNRSANDAILKDISSTGFGIVVDSAVAEYEINQTIHTVFNDEIEEVNQKYSFQLYGIIMRKEEMENGKVIYGCRLNSKVRGLDTYIMIKERVRLKNKMGN